MNRQQLYTLGGALLASTALATVANAGTIGRPSVAAGTGSATTLTSSAVKISNTIFSTTTSTADAVTVGGAQAWAVSFTNTFTPTTKFSVEIDVSGAQINTAAAPDIRMLLRDQGTNSGTFGGTISATAASCSITPLVGKIILDSCQVSTYSTTLTSGTGANLSAAAGGLLLSGMTFNTANALASAGNSIALSGSVYNTNNPSQVFESLTSNNIITSATPITATIGACGGNNATVDPVATPAAFDYFKAGGAVGDKNLTLCLATVNITGSTVKNVTLAATVGLTDVVSSLAVTVTDTLLGSAATTGIMLQGNGMAAFNNQTAANFSGGSATFDVDGTTMGASNFGAGGSFQIYMWFNGTTPIPAAAAGTVAIVYGSGAGSAVVAPTAASGSSASVSRGGFNSELNTFLASTNTSFTSFARLHNMGVTAGSAQITVLNDATGAQLGSSFTTASIAAGQTLQMSNKDIETAAGITAASGVNYTVQITGPFIGYAQHIIFNPATGQLADLSGFRNHDAGSSGSP